MKKDENYTTAMIKDRLYEIMALQGKRKYIGVREINLIRKIIRSVELVEKTENEIHALYWNDREVRG